MFRPQERSIRPQALSQRIGPHNKPPFRRASALNNKSTLKEKLSKNNNHTVSFHNTREIPKEDHSFDLGKTSYHNHEKSVAAFVPKEKESLNITQEMFSAQRQRKRISQVWTQPSELKLKGLWQQYEEIWFGIHSSALKPLLAEFHLPKTEKTLNKTSEYVQECPQIIEDSEPVCTVEKKPKEYKIRQLSSKTKKREVELVSCGHCKQKKRRGVYIECGHYFCRDCLRDHIQNHIDLLKIPIRCMSTGCTYELTRIEIIRNADNSENVVKYFDLNIADFVKRRPHQMVQCFTEGCKYVVIMTKLKYKNILSCPNCKVYYCIACHKPITKRHSCEDQNNLEATKHPFKHLMAPVSIN